MGDEERSSSAQGNGIDADVVMQKYTYPGQWFDDLGALVASTSPGVAWDLGTSSLSRDEVNSLIGAYQQMGVTSYPGE